MVAATGGSPPQGRALHGKVAVYDEDELLHVDIHALFLHLHPDRVEDVVIQVHTSRNLGFPAMRLVVSAGHQVALYLVSHQAAAQYTSRKVAPRYDSPSLK